ncbi:MAG: hypothetical protein ABTD50_14380 [Polyangiaceae bacterium]
MNTITVNDVGAHQSAQRGPDVMREHNARSNIHAGMTTAASSTSVQTKTSWPPRRSR